MKYLLLDVAGTILYKPLLFTKITEVLNANGYQVAADKLKYNHKLLSEAIKFPDRTDQAFYHSFNAELLYSLGILPATELLNKIFEACSYLPWEKFEDTEVLQQINIPIGIVSNFNNTLRDKLVQHFGPIFKDVFVSEEIGIAKPELQFYQGALDKIGIDAKNIIYVGDSFKLDLKPALELGLNAYVIDRDGVFPKSDRVINSLAQLTNLIG